MESKGHGPETREGRALLRGCSSCPCGHRSGRGLVAFPKGGTCSPAPVALRPPNPPCAFRPTPLAWLPHVCHCTAACPPSRCHAGLGKTTLAHVCAAHCGYRPLEINASDDRSGASLQARIQDAVEMQARRRPLFVWLWGTGHRNRLFSWFCFAGLWFCGAQGWSWWLDGGSPPLHEPSHLPHSACLPPPSHPALPAERDGRAAAQLRDH